ncbi:uncharacterized protein METZ01_LOCUS497259, partial [marine metagenome]
AGILIGGRSKRGPPSSLSGKYCNQDREGKASCTCWRNGHRLHWSRLLQIPIGPRRYAKHPLPRMPRRRQPSYCRHTKKPSKETVMH